MIQPLNCKPEILLNRQPGQPRISIILTDWGALESFHSLRYLNCQTVDRSEYELIWVEFYDRKPTGLRQMLAESIGQPPLDKWILLGYPDDAIFHRHRLYNVGLLSASGEVCVFCRSDAVFPPTFIASLLRAFQETPQTVIHLDLVRNEDWRFYPFQDPAIEDILGQGCVNWTGTTTHGLSRAGDGTGLVDHEACMAARRRDLLAIGGADEHLDYLGFVSGPYEMTFRLINHGLRERWLKDEFLYHVWSPNPAGVTTDYRGPQDDRGLSLRALDARATSRIDPFQRSPLFQKSDNNIGLERVLEILRNREEPTWRIGSRPPGPSDRVYQIERDYQGFNIVSHAGKWYALDNSKKMSQLNQGWRSEVQSHLRAETLEELRRQITCRRETREESATLSARCQPRVLLNRRTGKPKISVILIDWGVRESFHSLHYLNRQTANRADYELIWLEFYNREPEGLRQMVASGSSSSPLLDKWIVLGYPDNLIYHKHRLYNIGILAAEGTVCVICDSDAIFAPTFIDSLLQAFQETPNAVIHVDEVRNNDHRFYPFAYPSIEDVIGPGAINWNQAADATEGVDNPHDPIHQANYGACLAARRQDLLAIGGSDEHSDYLGYICGPYDLTFRLVNYGRTEALAEQ